MSSPAAAATVTSVGAKRKMAETSTAAAAATIGTHSGSFHCDEALGCYLLHQTAKWAGATVVRTRDPERLKGLDVVIDVGGVYDPGALRCAGEGDCAGQRFGWLAGGWLVGRLAGGQHRRALVLCTAVLAPTPPLHRRTAATERYDHHQRGFEEVFGHGFATKLSSAGLVYKHYGREIVAGAMGLPTDHPDVQVRFRRAGVGGGE